MKNRYHIIIDSVERAAIQRVFEQLGIDVMSTIIHNTANDVIYNYIVNLSKYELLYLRLACKTGWINIDESEANEKILHTSPTLHSAN